MVTFVSPVAVIQINASNYSVSEGDVSVEVCLELTSLPGGGLQREISATLDCNNFA